MNDLPAPGSHVHFVAICGVGMASLAGLLQSRGYRVTGSDQNVYPPMSTYLNSIGIEVLGGYSEQHLEPQPDLVVIGNAVSAGNAEARRALTLNIPYISFPEALGKFLIRNRQAFVIAGTHGKTTTAALAAWVLTKAGLDPGFFVGGVPLNFSGGWREGRGEHVVVEGDEYDSAFFDKGPKFLHYRPRHVILTSIEFDHADIYRDLDHLKSAFRGLVALVPADGKLVACTDYAPVLEVASAWQGRLITYGQTPGAHWSAANIAVSEGRSFFEPCYLGKPDGRLEVSLIGRHNVQNALGVYCMGRELGIQREELAEGFATFAGVRRRQEIKGSARGVLVIDDFAHHPTAVRETIEAVRAAYPGRRLWAVFEPRSNTSRRNIFERDYTEALARADRVIMAGVHQPEKVPDEQRLSADKVVSDINVLAGERRAAFIDKAADIPDYLAENASPGDIVLVMSNGAFDGVQEKILGALAG